jgi:hypothetical protein
MILGTAPGFFTASIFKKPRIFASDGFTPRRSNSSLAFS